ncbi:MAG: inositol monophosphatase [Sphingomonadales bacterium]|nr:inositol monophosphatase [Sphingomonadales bacterium]MDE2568084.1 inositol monophosphatase [Sphingomonadales bacterium]
MSAALDKAVQALVQDAAERAIRPRFQSLGTGEIITKAEDDLVTIADRESEAILSEGLAKLLPTAAIVGEESAFADPALMERLGDALCWIVDPLDGTNNFAQGKPPFGILVALSENGEAVSGWIYDVLTGRFCSAHRGKGAWIDGDRVSARVTGQEPPVAGISMLFMDGDKRAAMKRHIAPHYSLVDIPRCAAEQYPRLVTGVNDCTVFERTLPWDHAAGALFVNEAGGRVARLDGSDYRVDEDRTGLIGAATPQMWIELAARLRQL